MISKDIKNYDYIDALRGVAIMGVVAVHCGHQIEGLSKFAESIIQSGARGVQLFFVVSAYTLSLSIASRKNTLSHSWLAYFIRRFFRIAPMFYVGGVVYTLYFGFEPKYWAPTGVSLTDVVATVFFVHGWFPTSFNSVVPGGWSIANEAMFYLILPIILLITNSTAKALFFFVVSIAVSLSAYNYGYFEAKEYFDYLPEYLIWSYVFLSFPVQFPAFMAGILVFHVLNSNEFIVRVGGWGLLMLFMVFLVVRVYLPEVVPDHLHYVSLYALVVILLHNYRSKVFIPNILVSLGKISYSCYIVHFGVIGLLVVLLTRYLGASVLSGFFTFFALYMVVMVITSVISQFTFRYIEVAGVDYGVDFIKRVLPIK